MRSVTSLIWLRMQLIRLFFSYLRLLRKCLSIAFTKKAIPRLVILAGVVYLVKYSKLEKGFDIDKVGKWFARKVGESEAYSSQLLPREELPATESSLNETNQLVLNTSNCKIPNFLPWSAPARKLLFRKCTKYFWEPPKCEENHSWTFINNSYLYINLTAVKNSGYSWNSIRCCYRVINRVEQSLDKYDMKADKQIRYSKECFPIKQAQQLIKAEFIRVFCVSTSVPWLNDVVYREFLALAQLDKVALEKIRKWKNLKDSHPNTFISPPNVLIIGVDTMSRLNAYRTLNETLKELRSMGAVEMKGYTKVGETTFPNTVAFLTGYPLQILRRFCYEDIDKAQDLCPYLFKPFNQVGYLTAEIDDVPLGSAFNFLKTGFVKKPTDFYLRPMMLAVMKHSPRKNHFYVRCLGRKRLEQALLDYLKDVLEMASGAPVFAHAWFAAFSHECSVAASYGDSALASFLRKVDKDNSIIFFMGDHGEVFGDFRETEQGWYEDKLPMMWVYLPPRLRQLHPSWVQSLQTNSIRLTSHFDLYKTLVHILQSFDKDRKAAETYSRLPTQFGISLFDSIPEERSCDDAGIPDGYCPCATPQSLIVSEEYVIKSADKALQYIVNLLPGECATPKIRGILQAKSFITPEGYAVFIIRFITEPGSFMFEGTVRALKEKRGNTTEVKFTVANDVLRMNKITRKVDCVAEPLLERYCYCK